MPLNELFLFVCLARTEVRKIEKSSQLSFMRSRKEEEDGKMGTEMTKGVVLNITNVVLF